MVRRYVPKGERNMARPEVIDPIELTNRIHNKISALIKKELADEGPNIQRVQSLGEADDIVINTLTEMTAEATKRITGK